MWKIILVDNKDLFLDGEKFVGQRGKFELKQGNPLSKLLKHLHIKSDGLRLRRIKMCLPMGQLRPQKGGSIVNF